MSVIPCRSSVSVRPAAHRREETHNREGRKLAGMGRSATTPGRLVGWWSVPHVYGIEEHSCICGKRENPSGTRPPQRHRVGNPGFAVVA